MGGEGFGSSRSQRVQIISSFSKVLLLLFPGVTEQGVDPDPTSGSSTHTPYPVALPDPRRHPELLQELPRRRLPRRPHVSEELRVRCPHRLRVHRCTHLLAQVAHKYRLPRE